MTSSESVDAVKIGLDQAEKEFGIKPTPIQRAMKQAFLQKTGIEPKQVKESLTKPSRKTKRTSPYPLTESEILQKMLAGIGMKDKKTVRPSPVSMIATIERLQGKRA
jgi:hypothetical protein